jgi:NitT/TauT family transport system permease protein
MLLISRPYFYENLWKTLSVIGLGFILASASAAILAIGMSLSPWVRRGVYPVIVAGNVVPKVALIPLIIVTVGFGSNARIIVVIMSAFFPVFLNTLAAMIDADLEGEKLLTSLGASRWQQMRMHKLPAGLPSIFAGLKVSLTVAFIAGVLSELLIRREGLGYLITVYRATIQVDMVFAVTVTVGLIGMAIYFGMEWLERHLVFWKNSQQSDSTPL